MDAVAGLQPHVADTFVVEHYPALQHVDDLEFERVPVRAGLSGTVRDGPDDLRMEPTGRRRLDTEVAILVERAQTLAAKRAVPGMADTEPRRWGGHDLLSLIRRAPAPRSCTSRQGRDQNPTPSSGPNSAGPTLKSSARKARSTCSNRNAT